MSTPTRPRTPRPRTPPRRTAAPLRTPAPKARGRPGSPSPCRGWLRQFGLASWLAHRHRHRRRRPRRSHRLAHDALRPHALRRPARGDVPAPVRLVRAAAHEALAGDAAHHGRHRPHLHRGDLHRRLRGVQRVPDRAGQPQHRGRRHLVLAAGPPRRGLPRPARVRLREDRAVDGRPERSTSSSRA